MLHHESVYRLSFVVRSISDCLLRKKNKLCKRLPEGDVWGLDFFCKPKEMHQKIYDRLLDEFLEVDGQIDIQMEVHFGDLI